MDWATIILFAAIAWIVVGLIAAVAFGALARNSERADADNGGREAGKPLSADSSSHGGRTGYVPSRSGQGNP